MVNGVVAPDGVAATLRELAQHYSQRLGSAARVDQVYGQGVSVHLRPTSPGAAEVGWTDLGDDLWVAVGERNWRRLGRRPQDVELIESLCDAVIAGRVHRVTAPGRALVTLHPTAGPPIRMVCRTSWTGLLPLPAWTHWGHHTAFTPYD